MNVAAQRRDPGSLLTWMQRALRIRKQCVEIGWSDWKLLPLTERGLIAMRYDWQRHAFVAVHNFGPKPAVASDAGDRLVNLWSGRTAWPTSAAGT